MAYQRSKDVKCRRGLKRAFQSLGEGEELYEENGILYLLKIHNFLKTDLENGQGSSFCLLADWVLSCLTKHKTL